MGEENTRVKFAVNGVERDLLVGADTKLADILRRDLGLTGTKIGCGDGQCGSCTVLVDDKPVRSCIYPARRVDGKQVLTIEGLAATWGQPGQLHPLQRAFIDHGAIQCGFCTPGLLMAAAGLWNTRTRVGAGAVPDDEEIKKALGRNACRCTGYASILRAVRSAFHEVETGEPLPPVDIETIDPLRVVGHSYAQPDAVAKVTGAARFADDYSFPDMLHGATLRAAYPHARILSIDTGRATALPGVHAVLTHRDVPGRNRHGLVFKDWPVLCDDKVRYLGDAVALVAAETPRDRAARRCSSSRSSTSRCRWWPAPNRPGSPAPLWCTRTGRPATCWSTSRCATVTVEQGFAQADVIVEREYRTPLYDHMFMEPECSIGVPAGYDDDHPKLTVYVGSQIPYADRAQIAAALGLPAGAGAGQGHPDRWRLWRQGGHHGPDPRRPAGAGHRPPGQDPLRPGRVDAGASQAARHRHPHQDRRQA